MNQYSKILVTGGCGFIGSNFIIKHIGNNSYHILIIDDNSPDGSAEKAKKWGFA